jgi:hypothetical protein
MRHLVLISVGAFLMFVFTFSFSCFLMVTHMALIFLFLLRMFVVWVLRGIFYLSIVFLCFLVVLSIF